MKKSITIVVLILLVLAIGVWQYRNYKSKYEKNVREEAKLFIPTGANMSQIYDSLSLIVNDIATFKSLAQRKGLQKVTAGRYTIHAGENNNQILKRLMAGEQDNISLTIGNYASVWELASKVAPYLELDTLDIIEAVANRPEAQGLDTAQWIYFLAPNTYFFHWTDDAAAFIEKLAAQYHKYWSQEKRQQLAAGGLSELQAITLSSIVQLESYKVDEQPKVAGLYLNRLAKGMKLDADPTVIFAKKRKEGWQQKIQRVYYKDLAIESPYNTYRNTGLPPGPICMPNPSAIDAVLAPTRSSYIFFVADPSRPGYHLYATTLAEQEKNAEIYRAWIQNQNIK